MKNVIKFLSCVMMLTANVEISYADSSDVHIVVARLDYLTYSIKGYYEFSQPYELTDFTIPYTLIGNVAYYQQPAVDFGYTNAISAITGDTLFHASTIWSGTGRMVFPHDSLFKVEYNTGIISSPPDTVLYVLLFESTSESADTAWSRVEGTDFIHRLESIDNYDVAVFDHYFSVGVGDPTTAEWIIVAYTIPLLTGIYPDEENIPNKNYLAQNYPNPFNPVTKISYSLPVSGDVTLIIYNLLGEEVARLVDGFQQAGKYNTTWNASNVSSGIYFYRLQSADFTETRKMVLLK